MKKSFWSEWSWYIFFGGLLLVVILFFSFSNVRHASSDGSGIYGDTSQVVSKSVPVQNDSMFNSSGYGGLTPSFVDSIRSLALWLIGGSVFLAIVNGFMKAFRYR